MQAGPVSRSRLRRWLTLVFEALAVVATLFALFEIFVARRVAPIHLMTMTECTAADSAAARRGLGDFLLAQQDGFVFLDMDLAALRRCDGTDRDAYGGEVIDQLPSGFLVYDSAALDGSVLTRYHTAEDFIEERLRGLFYVRNRPGEGADYLHLIPAPFDSGTQRMHACTDALTAPRWTGRFTAYLRHCIFS